MYELKETLASFYLLYLSIRLYTTLTKIKKILYLFENNKKNYSDSNKILVNGVGGSTSTNTSGRDDSNGKFNDY